MTIIRQFSKGFNYCKKNLIEKKEFWAYQGVKGKSDRIERLKYLLDRNVNQLEELIQLINFEDCPNDDADDNEILKIAQLVRANKLTQDENGYTWTGQEANEWRKHSNKYYNKEHKYDNKEIATEYMLGEIVEGKRGTLFKQHGGKKRKYKRKTNKRKTNKRKTNKRKTYKKRTKK